MLDTFLIALQQPPLHVTLSALAYDTKIPESILLRLVALQHNPDDAAHIHAADFHTVFANTLFRYPTVKLWQLADGSVYVEM
jgi:hypothetical protein